MASSSRFSSSVHRSTLPPPPPPPPPPRTSVPFSNSHRPPSGLINHDSSWINKYENNKKNRTTIKMNSMNNKKSTRRMMEAFEMSMRCSTKAAKSRTTKEERTSCIHVGKLLIAIDSMKHCMVEHTMNRGVNDVTFHSQKVQLLYQTVSIEKRDHVLELMSYELPKPTKVEKDNKRNSHLLSPSASMKSLTSLLSLSSPTAVQVPTLTVKSASSRPSSSNSISTLLSNKNANHSNSTEDITATLHHDNTTHNATFDFKHFDLNDTLNYSIEEVEEKRESEREEAFQALSAASPATTTTTTNVAYNDEKKEIIELTTDDIKQCKKSLFWLCYYVRYLYDMHRLVLKERHDPVDASSMCYMRHLYPHSFYSSTNDSNNEIMINSTNSNNFNHHDDKLFLTVIADYQIEHFFITTDAKMPSTRTITNSSTNGKQTQVLQNKNELNMLLGVWEVLLYLLTPAFTEIALEGELHNNLTSGQ